MTDPQKCSASHHRVAWLLVGLTLLPAVPASAQQNGGPVLELESKVPLGAVNGRIDHLAFDLSRKHLFIAELQNNSVRVVDLGSDRLLHRMTGLSEPQGVGYVPSVDIVCHNVDLSGQANVPRIVGQREDYPLKVLREYKNGTRQGYDDSMAEALQPVKEQDIPDLAYFAARQP